MKWREGGRLKAGRTGTVKVWTEQSPVAGKGIAPHLDADDDAVVLKRGRSAVGRQAHGEAWR